MQVRARFKCTQKTSHLANVPKASGAGYEEKEVGTVNLTPVSGDDNKPWSVWTPSGSLTMTINNPEAYEQFKLGREYWLDLTEIVPVVVPEPLPAAAPVEEPAK